MQNILLVMIQKQFEIFMLFVKIKTKFFVSKFLFTLLHIIVIGKLNLFYLLNSFRFISDLEFFKIRNKVIIPFVYLRLVNLQTFLSVGKTNPLISSEINQIFIKNNYNIKSFILLFSKAFMLAYEKCKKYISTFSFIII